MINKTDKTFLIIINMHFDLTLINVIRKKEREKRQTPTLVRHEILLLLLCTVFFLKYSFRVLSSIILFCPDILSLVPGGPAGSFPVSYYDHI